jgi:hypothetical protein
LRYRNIILLVAIRLHRPRSVPAKAATFFALYATAGLLAGLVPFAALPGDWALGLVAFLLVAAFVVGQQLVWAGFWSLLGGLLAAGTFIFLTSYGVHASTLAWRGQQMQATVTHISVTRVKASSARLHTFRTGAWTGLMLPICRTPPGQ